MSYHNPFQSSFKLHQTVQPTALRIPPEATVVGPLLLKPTEFLSEAAFTLSAEVRSRRTHVRCGHPVLLPLTALANEWQTGASYTANNDTSQSYRL